MKKIGLILAIAVAAGTAQAKDNVGKLLQGVNANGGTGNRSISTLNVNVAGTPSWDSYGSANNVVIGPNIGANSHVIGIGWDVSLSTVGASWLSELQVSFEDSTAATGVWLTPGVADGFPGSGVYTSGGVVDLIGLGLDFTVGGDGVLRMEFFEGFDDISNSIDGFWDAGILTVQYEAIPAPGSLALLAGAGFIAARRRR